MAFALRDGDARHVCRASPTVKLPRYFCLLCRYHGDGLRNVDERCVFVLVALMCRRDVAVDSGGPGSGSPGRVELPPAGHLRGRHGRRIL